jgi:hypothetical protein
MSNTKTRLASGLVAAALTAGLAAAQGLPSVAQPPAPPAAETQIQVDMLNNTAKGYQIGSPAGWQVIAGSAELDYGFLAPDQDTMCLSWSFAIEGLADVSDEQLRQAMSIPQGEQFWKEDFFSQFQDVKFLHTGAVTNHPGGWPLQTVIATASISENGSPAVNYTFAGIFTAKKGSIYRVICFAKTSAYEQAKGNFFAVFDSFKITK